MLIADMLTQVLGKVEGCPSVEAENAMRDAAAEFCTRTRCWAAWETLEAAATVGTLDMERQVLDIIEATTTDRRPLLVLAQNDPAIDDLGSQDMALVFEDPSVATLVPTPAAPLQLRLFRAFAPGPTATELPDVLWLRYSAALIDGCLARLYAEPSQAWGKPALVSYHLQSFEDAIRRVAAECGANRKQTGRRLRVRPASL